MSIDLPSLIFDIAACIKRIDERRLQAANARSGDLYQPGIGPHPETEVVRLLTAELREFAAAKYDGRLGTGISYPGESRQRCDLCLGQAPHWEWAIEVKMLRLIGDNGKPNGNMLMHILSPYPAHRSALTDCSKLMRSGPAVRRAIVIYGFDHGDFPMDPAIEAFEVLARARVSLGPRLVAGFQDLVHPVHRQGRVFGWEIKASAP